MDRGFVFSVDATGAVSTPSSAAVGTGSRLSFRNTTITIDPALYAGRYLLSSHTPATFTGRQTLVLVPGITYTLDNGAAVG